MKKCPYCAEEIRGEAIKCRYCGEWLQRPPANGDATPHSPREADAAPATTGRGEAASAEQSRSSRARFARAVSGLACLIVGVVVWFLGSGTSLVFLGLFVMVLGGGLMAANVKRVHALQKWGKRLALVGLGLTILEQALLGYSGFLENLLVLVGLALLAYAFVIPRLIRLGGCSQ